MKNVLITIFSGALMLGVAVAQDSATPPPSLSSEPQTSAPAQPSAQPQPSAQAPQAQSSQGGGSSTPAGAPKRIAPGSVIPVELTKTVDAKKAKTGDEVVAKVTQDMKTSTGEVLVPKDTKVMGHVTEVQARNKEQKESQVGIVFDRAVMKNGEMQMPMSIQAIIGPQNNQNAAGGESGYEAPAPRGSSASPSTGRGGSTSGSSPNPNSSSSAGSAPSDAQGGANARPPITAKTEGVVGISDLKLNPTPPSANEGSVVSSDKNNVKLESGTMMLLRVNQ